MGKHRLRIVAIVLAAVAVLIAGIAFAGSRSTTVTGLGSTTGTNTGNTNVVFVHGSGCGAIEYTRFAQKAEAAALALPVSNFHSVGYYACDAGGESILHDGSASYLPSTDDNGQDTAIQRISYELAWYLWDNFGAKNEAVDLVGHSMGGIVITYALQRIAAHDPNYPKHLTVHTVVTFSSPFDGVNESLCGATVTEECRELQAGSALLREISSVGTVDLGGKTTWTLVGSQGRDAIPASSALGLPGATYRIDYTFPAYTHTAYLVDTAAVRNATGTINGTPFRHGAHSLALLAQQLS